MTVKAASRLLGSTKYHKPEGKIVILGFGSVGQAILPLVLRHLDIPPQNVTVLDKIKHPLFQKYESSGVGYITQEITKQNMDEVLSSVLKAGDFLINVSLNIDGVAIVTWCLQHSVLYVDTSIERWPDEQDEGIPNPAERTLYQSHQEIRRVTMGFTNAATAVVTHGANPGLVSHFTKQALLEVAYKMGIHTDKPQNREEWADLAERTGTKVIQVAERDTQVLKFPKRANEFVNTWSCEGFWAEGRAPSEMGWGTHENPAPINGKTQGDSAYLNQPGVGTLVKSWVPHGGQYNGFLIQHSEAITISEYLATRTYNPTVYYAYQPCDAALVSVHEMRGAELDFHRRTRIAKNSIVAGIDELGVLLLGHGLNGYWYGSQLSIEEARKLVPGESATSLQVAASLLGAIVWAYKNPDRGYIEPDYLPFDFVLNIAKQYLGPVVGVQTDWNPLQNRHSLYNQNLDRSDVWNFENFRVI